MSKRSGSLGVKGDIHTNFSPAAIGLRLAPSGNGFLPGVVENPEGGQRVRVELQPTIVIDLANPVDVGVSL